LYLTFSWPAVESTTTTTTTLHPSRSRRTSFMVGWLIVAPVDCVKFVEEFVCVLSLPFHFECCVRQRKSYEIFRLLIHFFNVFAVTQLEFARPTSLFSRFIPSIIRRWDFFCWVECVSVELSCQGLISAFGLADENWSCAFGIFDGTLECRSDTRTKGFVVLRARINNCSHDAFQSYFLWSLKKPR
jgi:hypothetical protein